MSDSIQKRGRGRPSGSYSFVSVSMKDLQRVIGENGNVTVSAKFAQELGISAVSVDAAKTHKRSFASEGGTVSVTTVTPTASSSGGN